MDLSRIKEEYARLSNIQKNDPEYENALMNLYDIEELMECEHFAVYDAVAKFCKNNGFNRVFDIGCADGYQSEMFLQNDLEYVGVEGFFTGKGYWNDDKFLYIEKEYPFSISTSAKDIAVSHMCIGWNCYKTKEDTWERQIEQLAADFRHILLYSQKEILPILERYYAIEEVSLTKNRGVWYYGKGRNK